MRTNDTQFNYLFEKIYELVELADFDIDDEDLLEAAKSVIYNLELDERFYHKKNITCLLYTSPSPRDLYRSRMPSSA